MVDTIIESRRSFTGPDEETEYFIVNPRAEDIRGADWEYSKSYTNCLSEGITTSAEMMDILRRRGIIGDDYDRRSEELSIKLNESIAILYESTSNEDKTEAAIGVAKSRETLFQWNQRLSGPMSNTCEQISDDVRLEFLTSCMVQTKEGERVWKTHDDFLTSSEQTLTMKARYEIMLFLQGYDSDFLENTPEASAMREVENDILEKATAEIAKVKNEDKEKKIVTKTKVPKIKNKKLDKKKAK